MKLEANHTYLLRYGRGTQVFHCTKVSAKGKPFGLRAYGGNCWLPADIKVDDERVIGECALPAPLPELPAKVDVKPLKARHDAAKAAQAAFDAVHTFPEYVHGGDREAFREAQDAYYNAVKPINREFRDAQRKLSDAKIWNKILP
jgi:hypothetical protein